MKQKYCYLLASCLMLIAGLYAYDSFAAAHGGPRGKQGRHQGRDLQCGCERARGSELADRHFELELREHELDLQAAEAKISRIKSPTDFALEAIDATLEHLELEVAEEVLTDSLDQTQDAVVRTRIRQRLAELYIETDRSELAATQLQALIVIAESVTHPALADDTTPAKGMSVLIVDGQNNHKWQVTTPLIQKTLEQTGLFRVDVATSPGKGEDMKLFAPKFSDYDVVVSNYNGQAWSESTQKDFVKYVAGGGGLVVVHAADNSFSKWEAYNRMIGLGGWGGRNEKSGPYVRWKEDQKRFTRDMSPGRGGSHGKRVPFLIIVRESGHPITHGLPSSFMQTNDELYSQLRGPAENMHVLATAMSDTATGGSGEHEPILTDGSIR